MGTQYAFDVAFDWNDTPNGDGYLPISIGLVNMNTGPKAVGSGTATKYQLEPGDSFFINCFNITSGATQSVYSISSGSVPFETGPDPLPGQTASSPFATPLTVALNTANKIGPSKIFVAKSQYPVWAPLVPSQSLVNKGDFKFSVKLAIEGPNSVTKKFQTDPEIIVQATGI